MSTIANTPLPAEIQLPVYERKQLRTRIVHIGFGAFHRAHQAIYTHRLAQRGGSDWGICEISLFSGTEIIQQLRQQDHLFTVTEKETEAQTTHVVGIVTDSRQSKLDGRAAVLEVMTDPEVEIVSLTVTEKGYCLDVASGKLDLKHPLIQADLKTPTEPSSVIGYLVEALRQRKEAGHAPFTVMSCDNIQGNGHIVQSAIHQYAMLCDPALAAWIEALGAFPCTMVDRIVPAATEETLSEIATTLGVYDPCAIACESFNQWIIEDNFVGERPDWDLVGAQFVEDVLPYEEMKLRMLNGSHSFLAYLGYLSGYEYIAETMSDPDFRRATLTLMLDVQAASLNMPKGFDLNRYARQLVTRFSNTSLKHRTWQIAMDGSQKIPQRILGSLRYHLNRQHDTTFLATIIAGWMRYVTGEDEQGQAIDVRDPMAEKFAALYQQFGHTPEYVQRMLCIEGIFSEAIGQNPIVIQAVQHAYQKLIEHGAKATVAEIG